MRSRLDSFAGQELARQRRKTSTHESSSSAASALQSPSPSFTPRFAGAPPRPCRAGSKSCQSAGLPPALHGARARAQRPGAGTAGRRGPGGSTRRRRSGSRPFRPGLEGRDLRWPAPRRAQARPQGLHPADPPAPVRPSGSRAHSLPGVDPHPRAGLADRRARQQPMGPAPSACATP